MEKEIIQKWETNKSKLQDWLKLNHPSSYKALVEKLFELVINSQDGSDFDDYNWRGMTVIDDGSYQGTQIFIVPKNTYQPSREDYLVTDTYYGSCSGCDTLQGICGYGDEPPTKTQVSEYMTLALHLVQKMKQL